MVKATQVTTLKEILAKKKLVNGRYFSNPDQKPSKLRQCGVCAIGALIQALPSDEDFITCVNIIQLGTNNEAGIRELNTIAGILMRNYNLTQSELEMIQDTNDEAIDDNRNQYVYNTIDSFDKD